MSVESLPTDLLWRSALAVIPLALIVAAVCRWTPCRPATRHALWLMVLVLLVAAPLLPRLTLPQLPAGPPAATVDAPPREFPIRRAGEAIAPTASSGPPAAASLDAPTRSITAGDRKAPLPGDPTGRVAARDLLTPHLDQGGRPVDVRPYSPGLDLR